ncbi:DUF2142 domain-containing protein [Silvibacterium sp.]|uniref:DUF2142 domain-containing protein n=1 Tax=Silvibacterium sp. TaxID=1964179 RepID=UPI0039E4AE71
MIAPPAQTPSSQVQAQQEESASALRIRVAAIFAEHRSRLIPTHSKEARAARLYPMLYVGFALPVILVLCFVSLPCFVPDEANHLLRADQVSCGEVIGESAQGAEAGGQVDSGLLRLANGFSRLRNRWKARYTGAAHPPARISLREFQSLETIQWSGSAKWAGFGNTAIYPPTSYLPQAAGLWMGARFGLSVLHTIFLARLLTALCAMALGCWAIAICGSGRLLLAVVLLLPQTLYLYASMSQDAMLIAYTLCGLALVSRAVTESRLLSSSELPLALCFFLMCAAARPPLLLLSAVLLLPPLCLRRTRRETLRTLGCLALLAAVTLAWSWRAKHLGPLTTWNGGNPPAQVIYVQHHLSQVPGIALHTIKADWGKLLFSMIGCFGYLDTFLPGMAYPLFLELLVAAVLLDSRRRRVRPALALLVVASVAGVVAVMYALEYLIATPPGGGHALGMQGRYLLPLLPALGLLGVVLPRPREWGRPALVLVLAGIVDLRLPLILASEFYHQSLWGVLQMIW